MFEILKRSISILNSLLFSINRMWLETYGLSGLEEEIAQAITNADSMIDVWIGLFNTIPPEVFEFETYKLYNDITDKIKAIENNNYKIYEQILPVPTLEIKQKRKLEWNQRSSHGDIYINYILYKNSNEVLSRIEHVHERALDATSGITSLRIKIKDTKYSVFQSILDDIWYDSNTIYSLTDKFKERINDDNNWRKLSKCHYCGTKIYVDERKCPSCGASL
jgi:hypothetical protein